MINKMYYKNEDIRKSIETMEPIMVTKSLIVSVVQIGGTDIDRELIVIRIHSIGAFRIFSSVEDFNKFVKIQRGRL